MNSIYNLELNVNSEFAKQPENIKIKLKPHQLSALHKMIDMENSEYIKYNQNSQEIKIKTNIGLLGDIVGYGKTFEALALICANNIDNIHINYDYIKSYNSLYINNHLSISVNNDVVIKRLNKIKATLVIVPRGPVYVQWEKMIKEHTKLRVLAINNYIFIKNNLPKYNNNEDEIINFFNNYDIILIINTTFTKLINIFYENKKFINEWSRIIVDEAHDIINKIPQSLNYLYLWLISATYLDILAHAHNNIYTHGLKEILNKDLIYTILVKNEINFIKKSFDIPEPIEKYYLCKLAFEYLIAKRYINQTILDKINANDFAGAIRELGGKSELEDNIINLVSKELKRELYNLECDKNNYLLQDISIEDKNNKIKLIDIKINNQINKINDLTERIKNTKTNNCAICMDTIKNPVMLECTHLYCAACIFRWIKTANNCPTCRNIIKSYNEFTAIIDKTETVDEILSKEDTLIKIILNKFNGKFLIFTSNDNCFETFKPKLIANNITFDFLKGNTSHMMTILEKFKNGELKVIILNTQYAGSGIDINYASDVIIFHSMGYDKQQAIGRAQRVGRTEPLIIHNLCYEDEI